MKYYISVLVLLSLFVIDCRRSKEKELFYDKKFYELALFCSENPGKEESEECKTGRKKTREEIETILSQKKDNPFSRIQVEKFKHQTITSYIKKNPPAFTKTKARPYRHNTQHKR